MQRAMTALFQPSLLPIAWHQTIPSSTCTNTTRIQAHSRPPPISIRNEMVMANQTMTSFQSPGILHHPSAWTQKDLANIQWLVHFTHQQLSEIDRIIRAMPINIPLNEITPDKFPLPAMEPMLQKAREDLVNGIGFRCFRGIPIHKYTEQQAIHLFYLIGTYLGIARPQNKWGDVIGHVRNVYGSQGSVNPNVRIYQTNERQTFHTDSCDVVGLLCLKSACQGGDSLVVSAVAVYNEMCKRDPELLRLLFDPIATDRRGEVPPGELPYLLIPVLSYHQEFLSVFYQRQYIESAQRFESAPRLTPKHIKALDMFDGLCNDPQMHVRMRLEPGDIQLVHNHSLLHDRTAFRDGTTKANDSAAVLSDHARHLLRIWLSVEGDRPLPEGFAARFGSIEIGNRGGIRLSNEIRLSAPLI